MPGCAIEHARLQLISCERVEDAATEIHIAIRGQDETSARPPHPDVLRWKLEILEPGVQRQHVLVLGIHHVPRAHRWVELGYHVEDLLADQSGTARRRPL